MDTLRMHGYRILHQQTANNIINVRIIVNAGSSKELMNEHGVAHFLEHMFFKGTETKDVKEVNKLLAGFGSSNAYTGNTCTVYYIDTIVETFKQATALLTEIFFKPRFDSTDFEVEKNVITEEIQARLDNPIQYFFGKVDGLFYDQYRFHTVAGTKEEVNSYNIQQIKDFRDRFYTRENIIFAVTGNITAREILDTFGELLPIEPINCAFNVGVLNLNPMPAPNFQQQIFTHKSKQAIMALITEGLYGADFVRSSVQGILMNALGQDMHSLLYNKIREELGLCYSVGTYISTYENLGSTKAYILLDEKNIDQAKEEILKIFKQVRTDGISDELLAITKRNYLFHLASSLQESSSYAESFLDGYFIYDEVVSTYEDEVFNVNKVTNHNIINWAERYLQEDHIGCIIMTQEK